MDLFRVTVSVDGRNLDVVVKTGVIATIETGPHENKIEKPKNKVTVIVGQGKRGFAAWVQVSRFDESKSAHVTHEGWVQEGDGQLSRVVGPSAEMLKCQEDAEFGALACCTAYGSGCYVRCCNSCCSDPTRCPGASCCS